HVLTGNSLPTPLISASASHSPTTERSSAMVTDQVLPHEDNSCPVGGMYRLLDLIVEQENGVHGNNRTVACYNTLTAPGQPIRSSLPSSLSKHLSTRSLRVLILLS